MKKHINDDYHNQHLNKARPGLLRQEFVSYEVKDGTLYKETITRTFLNGDYTDSSSSIPLTKLEDYNGT